MIVVGLGLAMLFAEDFLPKDEPVAEPVAQTPKKKSQRELDKENEKHHALYGTSHRIILFSFGCKD